MNRGTRAAVLAALREIYDGSWTRHVGTDGGRTLSWSGKVALIAGCTPAIDNHHAVIGSMGERFVLYRLPPTDADVQLRRALEHVGREAKMRGELAAAVDEVLRHADTERVEASASDATTDRLVRLATLAVRCRSAVDRDSYSREITLIREPEAPARLGLVLLRLLNAMLTIGVDEEAAWSLVAKCALDSMPAVRRTVLEGPHAPERPDNHDRGRRARELPDDHRPAGAGGAGRPRDRDPPTTGQRPARPVGGHRLDAEALANRLRNVRRNAHSDVQRPRSRPFISTTTY
jgi:hypothetical protein